MLKQHDYFRSAHPQRGSHGDAHFKEYLLCPEALQQMALEQGARIHRQYSTEFETAFSVSWPRVQWSRGSWRSETSAAHEVLSALRRPDGRVHFAGDYMTNMSSWMQGTFESGREGRAGDPHTRTRSKLITTSLTTRIDSRWS